MINIHRALNNDRLMRSLTGLNRKAFEALLPAFIAAWQADRLAQVRKRAPGAGQAQKAKLSNPQQKLFYILFYFKCYPTFDLAGLISCQETFGNACRVVSETRLAASAITNSRRMTES